MPDLIGNQNVGFLMTRLNYVDRTRCNMLFHFGRHYLKSLSCFNNQMDSVEHFTVTNSNCEHLYKLSCGNATAPRRRNEPEPLGLKLDALPNPPNLDQFLLLYLMDATSVHLMKVSEAFRVARYLSG